jgi:CPA2 family monovalent cation:H+ antiporter-2
VAIAAGSCRLSSPRPTEFHRRPTLHETPLIATIVAGLGLAFFFALVLQRLRLPSIAGYLLAGVMLGPFTPGFVADQKLSTELSELGVILLMFGVGLHFSLKDLLSVRAVAVPGALVQITIATLLGAGLAYMLGWSLGAGLVFGLALSVASTVVLLRALQERRLVETERGRIAVGWLIVEDIAMVAVLVLLPPLAGLLGGTEGGPPADLGLVASLGLDTVSATLLLTAIKVAAFITLMLVLGRKTIPKLLHYVAHTGSRELFRLAVLAIALVIAYGSTHLFGVSFALGAFFAGMVLAESPLSQQAARDTLPLRDAFAVLFFVSVGMLFNPAVLIDNPLAVVAAFLTIVLGKSIGAYLLVRAFGHPPLVALTISASLAQIGEFSFILVALGLQLGVVPEMARDLVVAGALLSILLNPFLFLLLDRIEARLEKVSAPPPPVEVEVPPAREEVPTTLSGHAILVGHGRVGRLVAAALQQASVPLVVIDEEDSELAELRDKGIETFSGAAGERALLDRLNLAGARWLITAIPDAFEAGHLFEEARAANPAIRLLARAHSREEVDYLRTLGADVIVMGEEEIARGIINDIVGTVPPASATGGDGGGAVASRGS